MKAERPAHVQQEAPAPRSLAHANGRECSEARDPQGGGTEGRRPATHACDHPGSRVRPGLLAASQRPL